MDATHLLLGRPWLFDRRVFHDGFLNTYTFSYHGKRVTLHPMTPSEIVQYQLERDRHKATSTPSHATEQHFPQTSIPRVDSSGDSSSSPGTRPKKGSGSAGADASYPPFRGDAHTGAQCPDQARHTPPAPPMVCLLLRRHRPSCRGMLNDVFF